MVAIRVIKDKRLNGWVSAAKEICLKGETMGSDEREVDVCGGGGLSGVERRPCGGGAMGERGEAGEGRTDRSVAELRHEGGASSPVSSRLFYPPQTFSLP